MKEFDFDTEFNTEHGTIYVHAEGRCNDESIEYDILTANLAHANGDISEIDFPNHLFNDLDERAENYA